MKSLMPWVCLAAATSFQSAYADTVFDAYRQGEYSQAAVQLINAQLKDKDPVLDYYMAKMNLYGYGQLKNNTLALRYYRQAAEKGFLPAQNVMARYALLEDKNPIDALNWFKKAAEANDVAAQMYCASAYLFGVGVKPNDDVARKYVIAAARNGNGIAQYELAAHFLNSRQLANKKLGLIWLNKAVEQGNADAQIQLGLMFAKGDQVARDPEKAKQLIMQSASQGDVKGMQAMGDLAFAQSDFVGAKEWYSKAAEKNYIPSEIALGNVYLVPSTPFYNTHTGYLWMLKAAESGSTDAQLTLSKWYKEGKIIQKDDNLSKQWQTEATKSTKGDPSAAMVKAALWLSDGKGSNYAASGYQLNGIFSTWTNANALKQSNYNPAPRMDLITRDALFKPQFLLVSPNQIAISEYYNALSSALGELKQGTIDFPQYPEIKVEQIKEKLASNKPQASYILPVKDQNPKAATIGEETDVEVATFGGKSLIDQLTDQAILGDPDAEFALAQRYQLGIDVKKDMTQAIRFYQMAAAQSDLRSEYNLGILYLLGKDVPADYQQALNYLNDAAFKGSVYAQYVLARLQESGYRDAEQKVVIKPDPEQAESLYYLASANHFGPAQYRLAEILVRQPATNLAVADKEKQEQLIKQLYEGAAEGGIAEAQLPLAFFNAMDQDKTKQQQALAVAKTAASRGDGQGALLLGLMLDRGLGTEPNADEALVWYKKASHNAVSNFILGTYTSLGKDTGLDKEEGKNLIQQSADAGFSYANLNLAVMKQQQKQAFLPELDAAKALGNSTASLLLADYYLSNASDQTQMQQARDIYQTLADRGDKQGQLKLAYMFEQGLGGAVDMNSAQKWYSISAEQAEPIAQYQLGHLYQMGWLDKAPDYELAKKWYQSSQAQFAPSAVALGFIYDTVDDNYAQAASAYQIAVNQNNAYGLLDLGLIYEQGKGIPVDYQKAKDFYEKAAALGQSEAMVQLAGLYFNGLAGDRDEKAAVVWYKKAAEFGEQEALYQLGLLSETGVGMTLDPNAAVQYYQKSAVLGNDKAKMALARMYQYGQGVTKDLNQAMSIYKELADKDNPFAEYQLAALYYDGSVGQKSPQQGKSLLQQSAQNGSEQAACALQLINAQAQSQYSFIQPLSILPGMSLASQSVERQYLDAMNEWNRGNEQKTKQILESILAQFPHFEPAQRAAQQLSAPETWG